MRRGSRNALFVFVGYLALTALISFITVSATDSSGDFLKTWVWISVGLGVLVAMAGAGAGYHND